MESEYFSAPALKHYTSLVNLVNATLRDYLCIKNMPYQVVADAM